jgi:hypothetical protein
MNNMRWSVVILLVAVTAGWAWADINIAWQENFDPIKTTWLQPTAQWTDVAGPMAILTQSDPCNTFGKVESEPITINLATYKELVVSCTAIDSSCDYTVQIQEQEGSYSAVNVISNQSQPGTQIVNIAQVTGWSGSKTFTIVIWIGGGSSKSATFSGITLRDPRGFSNVWQEHFDPMKTTWYGTMGAVWTDIGGTTAMLTQTLTVGYSKTETECVTVNLNDYTELAVRSDAMDTDCSYTIGLQEQGGGWEYKDLFTSSQFGTQVANITQKTGWTGTKSFRIVIWVGGDSGKTVSFDSIELRKVNTVSAWEDKFDPIKSTWYEYEAAWDDVFGPTATLRENSFFLNYGKVESEAITVNVTDYPLLDVVSTSVASFADYSIQIQSQQDPYPGYYCVQWSKSPDCTHHIFNIASATGWTGEHTFRIAAWIGGESGTATFDLFRVRAADASVFWQDHMNPVKTTWAQPTATWAPFVDPVYGTIGGTEAALTETSPADSFGKVESESITVDLNTFPELVVTSTAIDTDATYTIGIQEQEGTWGYSDVITAVWQPGTQIINIPVAMGWSGTKTFSVVVWIGGESKSAAFDAITLQKASSPVWEENFNQMKKTWNPISAVWTDTAGPTATLTENNPSEGFGKTESELITVNLNEISELAVTSTALDFYTDYSVGVQEEGGSYAYFSLISNVAQPGTQILNIAAATGWTGTKTFRIVIWVGGESGYATFDSIALRKAQTVPAWQEHFNPIKSTWYPMTASWTDANGSVAVLTENNSSESFGKAESEAITLNLDNYPDLTITSSFIDAGANYSIGIQEQGGLEAYRTVISSVTQPGTQVINVAREMGWTGTKTFRIVTWIGGEGKSVAFDLAQMNVSACGRTALPGDYNSDCIVNFFDLVTMGQSWRNAYTMQDLVEIANGWLTEK